MMVEILQIIFVVIYILLIFLVIELIICQVLQVYVLYFVEIVYWRLLWHVHHLFVHDFLGIEIKLLLNIHLVFAEMAGTFVWRSVK